MSLSARLGLATFFATVLLSALLIASGRMALSESQQRLADTAVTANSVLWTKIISSALEDIEAYTTALTRNRDAMKALRNNDQSALVGEADPILLRLTGPGTADGLTITGKDGTVLFSSPPELARARSDGLLEQAKQEGVLKKGLERTPQGQLTAVVAFPLFARGQLVGGASMVKLLDPAVEDFKANKGVEVQIETLDGGMDYSTAPAMFRELGLELPPAEQPTTLVGEGAEQLYSVVVVPIRDSNGAVTARLITASDDTESLLAQRRIDLISLLATLAVVVLTVVGMYYYICHALAPLRRVIGAAERVAKGDLTAHIEVNGKDEFAQLGRAIDGMIDHLREMVQKIAGSTVQLAAAAEQTNTVAERMRSGLDAQTISTEQVVTAITEMSATVDEVARNTVSAAEAAGTADAESHGGRDVVQQTAASIERLAAAMERAADVIERVRADSEGVDRVLDVIRDIAERTNLLALNAAIEAARAGEQGRGFAVVADEVRTLASRTAESTGEIQSIIHRLQEGAGEAVAAMNQGREMTAATTQQASDAGRRLQQIADSVGAINDMNTQIASAAQEQTAVAHDINENVVRISQVTEETAEGAKQTSAASAELAQLATELQQLVGAFKTH
jgi:methyl-accepting chemotaxis protein